MSNKNGFTIIELLTVIGAISILTAIGVPTYNTISKNVTLNNYAQEIVSSLRTAQNLSLSSQDDANWGIRFEQYQYVLCSEDCSNDITTYVINNGAEITTVGSVVFNRLSGSLNTDYTTITSIEVKLGGQEKTIEVDDVGKISLQ